jgi:hypothetical protein
MIHKKRSVMSEPQWDLFTAQPVFVRIVDDIERCAVAVFPHPEGVCFMDDDYIAEMLSHHPAHVIQGKPRWVPEEDAYYVRNLRFRRLTEDDSYERIENWIKWKNHVMKKNPKWIDRKFIAECLVEMDIGATMDDLIPPSQG